MDLNRLRQETAAEHAGTEDSVPLTSATLTRAEYVEMLRRFYRVVSAWDHWADAHVPHDLLPLLRGRRRATLLEADLHALGAAVPTDSAHLVQRMNDTVPGDARSVFLGRMYVMEGSTLGGQYIARHVEERLGLAHGQGNAYFLGYGDATGQRWREFKAVLAQAPDAEADTVIRSAKDLFAIFGEAMRDEGAAPVHVGQPADAGMTQTR